MRAAVQCAATQTGFRVCGGTVFDVGVGKQHDFVFVLIDVPEVTVSCGLNSAETISADGIAALR
jgi:hypothetical protein